MSSDLYNFLRRMSAIIETERQRCRVSLRNSASFFFFRIVANDRRSFYEVIQSRNYHRYFQDRAAEKGIGKISHYRHDGISGVGLRCAARHAGIRGGGKEQGDQPAAERGCHDRPAHRGTGRAAGVCQKRTVHRTHRRRQDFCFRCDQCHSCPYW